jgi:hydroxyacylglutathione hydrolase
MVAIVPDTPRNGTLCNTQRALMSPPTPLSAFSDNYIWTLGDPDTGIVVVDPGQAQPVLALLQQGLRLAAILLTHHHHDHIGGAAELIACTGAACYAPHDQRIDLDCERVSEESRVIVGGSEFTVMEAPGHTLSHVAFHGEGLLFCGDTLFSLGCGRLFEGTPAQMLDSLDRLSALPASTRVCCGHEYTLDNGAFALAVDPDNLALQAHLAAMRERRSGGRPSLPSTIEIERQCNPFLGVDRPEVMSAAAAWLGHQPTSRVECFAALRRWKDGFRAA